MKNSKNLFIFFISTLSLLIFEFEAKSKDIYFSGFSFMGNADQNFRYPVAHKLFTNNNLIFKEPLDMALKKLKRNDFKLIYNLGNIADGEAVALAFCVFDETIERFSTKEGVTNAYKIFAQILVFDFNEKKVITNFPVLVQNETLTSSVPDSQYDFGIVKNMYLNVDSDASIFKQWVKKLDTANILKAGTIHLKVRNVLLDDAVKNQIPQSLAQNDLLRIRSAQKLEYHISSKQNVPILPYTLGQIGNFKSGLIARFSDSLEYNLTLPDADYVIDLLIREFKNVTVDRGKFEVKIFAAFITIQALEPLTETVYLNSKFNFKNELIFPKSEKLKILNEWDVYQRSQDALFSKFAKQISQKDTKGLKEITNTGDIKNQLTKFEEVINKCK
tara:strand:+ start:1521 stop:2684 length:1164 start_codon:yes stop_codon:yes gene_type:complete